MLWNVPSKKFLHMGLSRSILYVHDSGVALENLVGVPWEGLISVTEKPGKGEITNLWSANREYAQLVAPETFSGQVEAYMYPPEFDRCVGNAEPNPGVHLNRQHRPRFSLCYRTEIYNDALGHVGYYITFLYNMIASSSERKNMTINESPQAMTFTWEVTSLPVRLSECSGLRPVSKIVIDSRVVGEPFLNALGEFLYVDQAFLTPCDVIALADAYPPPLDPTDPCAGLVGHDHIPDDTTLTIPAGCTMYTYGYFHVAGTLIVEGTLIAA